nr:DUF3265 domain-containing protein [Vibrio metschnikovii]
MVIGDVGQSSWVKKYNKAFKRDSQRVAFLLCVGFCDYSVMRKLGSSAGCPLTRRYSLLFILA